MITFYFSRIRGIKIDMNNSETKQGAAVPADLLQQKSHAEVIDLKSSAASSDEERLVAGISTIGLQVKRLSGAQRNFKGFWGLGTVIFRTLKDEKKKTEAESTTSEPPPQ